MVVPPCECTKNHCIAHFRTMNFMVLKLDINEKKRKGITGECVSGSRQCCDLYTTDSIPSVIVYLKSELYSRRRGWRRGPSLKPALGGLGHWDRAQRLPVSRAAIEIAARSQRISRWDTKIDTCGLQGQHRSIPKSLPVPWCTGNSHNLQPLGVMSGASILRIPWGEERKY